MNKKMIFPVLTLSACFLASCGGGAPKHNVKFVGEHYTVNNKSIREFVLEVNKGAKIGKIENIKADSGYKLPAQITVGGFASGYVWSRDAAGVVGSIDFKELIMPDADVTITIHPETLPGYHTVTFTGDYYDVAGGRQQTVQDGVEIPQFNLSIDESGQYDDLYFNTEKSSVRVSYDPEMIPPLDFAWTVEPNTRQIASLKFNGTMPNRNITIHVTVINY